MADNITIICCIVITIDDNHYPAPENVPKQKQQKKGLE